MRRIEVPRSRGLPGDRRFAPLTAGLQYGRVAGMRLMGWWGRVRFSITVVCPTLQPLLTLAVFHFFYRRIMKEGDPQSALAILPRRKVPSIGKKPPLKR